MNNPVHSYTLNPMHFIAHNPVQINGLKNAQDWLIENARNFIHYLVISSILMFQAIFNPVQIYARNLMHFYTQDYVHFIVDYIARNGIRLWTHWLGSQMRPGRLVQRSTASLMSVASSAKRLLFKTVRDYVNNITRGLENI